MRGLQGKSFRRGRVAEIPHQQITFILHDADDLIAFSIVFVAFEKFADLTVNEFYEFSHILLEFFTSAGRQAQRLGLAPVVKFIYITPVRRRRLVLRHFFKERLHRGHFSHTAGTGNKHIKTDLLNTQTEP